MNVKMNDWLEITTEHPASHYGAGVLIDNEGNVFGPCDIFPGSVPELTRLLNATPLTAAQAVVRICKSREFSPDEISLISRFLSQNPNPQADESL